jgi:hypothetical protein
MFRCGGLPWFRENIMRIFLDWRRRSEGLKRESLTLLLNRPQRERLAFFKSRISVIKSDLNGRSDRNQ